MDAIGSNLRVAHDVLTRPRQNKLWRLNVIRAGTLCRGIVWPCLVPIALYQYIRQKDRDYYAVEILAHRSGTATPEDFYDKARGPIWGHWRLRRDLEVIRKGVREAAE